MNIVLSKAELTRGVMTVSKAVPNKSTMPILECILFSAENGEITVIGSDTELSIKTVVDGSIIAPGKAAIDARMLTEMVRKLPDGGEVDIDVDADIALIKCKKMKAKIPCRDGEQFPKMPEVELGGSIVITQGDFKAIVRQTIFSSMPNSANRMMGGELFEVSGGNLKVVALDGHRVAIRKMKIADGVSDTKSIIPVNSLNDISKIMSDNNGNVEMYFTDKHAIFVFNDTTAITSVIDGEYFNINQIIGMQQTIEVRVIRKELLESVDRSTLLFSESDKKPIVMNISDDVLEWTIATTKGSMSEDLPISKTGDDIKIGFNPAFLKDTLSAIADDEVFLYMLNSKAPCIIKNADETYLYVILPVNFVS